MREIQLESHFDLETSFTSCNWVQIRTRPNEETSMVVELSSSDSKKHSASYCSSRTSNNQYNDSASKSSSSALSSTETSAPAHPHITQLLSNCYHWCRSLLEETTLQQPAPKPRKKAYALPVDQVPSQLKKFLLEAHSLFTHSFVLSLAQLSISAQILSTYKLLTSVYGRNSSYHASNLFVYAWKIQ